MVFLAADGEDKCCKRYKSGNLSTIYNSAGTSGTSGTAAVQQRSEIKQLKKFLCSLCTLFFPILIEGLFLRRLCSLWWAPWAYMQHCSNDSDSRVLRFQLLLSTTCSTHWCFLFCSRGPLLAAEQAFYISVKRDIHWTCCCTRCMRETYRFFQTMSPFLFFT